MLDELSVMDDVDDALDIRMRLNGDRIKSGALPRLDRISVRR